MSSFLQHKLVLWRRLTIGSCCWKYCPAKAITLDQQDITAKRCPLLKVPAHIHQLLRTFLHTCIFPIGRLAVSLWLSSLYFLTSRHTGMLWYIVPILIEKKNHVSSIPLPRMGHCSGLLLRERQLLVFWWEAPTTFLGQEMAYFSKKRPREKAWNSQILSSISGLTGDCLCVYQENWKWRKEGEGGVSGALGTFCLCCLHAHCLTHPERWHIIMNIHIHHCSSSALFSLPQRYYLHMPPFFVFSRQKPPWSYQHFWLFLPMATESKTFILKGPLSFLCLKHPNCNVSDLFSKKPKT